MIKINLHKNLSDFSPLRRYPRKIAFFTNKLYISDVYHIFLNRRDVKAYENQCFVWSLFWYRYVKFQALAHGLSVTNHNTMLNHKLDMENSTENSVSVLST